LRAKEVKEELERPLDILKFVVGFHRGGCINDATKMNWGSSLGFRRLDLEAGPFRMLGESICLEIHFMGLMIRVCRL